MLAILNAYNAASQASQTCELPLHQAIRNKYSEDVVLALFYAYKNASQKENVDGELPLHQAIKNEYSDEVVLEILFAYP